LFPTLFRLSLLTSGMIECIRFNGALQLTLHLIRQRGLPQPPAPAIARPDMAPHLPRNTPGRTGKAQQKGGEDPVPHRPLALVQQGMGDGVEGALAAMAPVAFAPGAVLVRAPASNVVALASRAWQRTIFPS